MSSIAAALHCDAEEDCRRRERVVTPCAAAAPAPPPPQRRRRRPRRRRGRSWTERRRRRRRAGRQARRRAAAAAAAAAGSTRTRSGRGGVVGGEGEVRRGGMLVQHRDEPLPRGCDARVHARMASAAPDPPRHDPHQDARLSPLPHERPTRVALARVRRLRRRAPRRAGDVRRQPRAPECGLALRVRHEVHVAFEGDARRRPPKGGGSPSDDQEGLPLVEGRPVVQLVSVPVERARAGRAAEDRDRHVHDRRDGRRLPQKVGVGVGGRDVDRVRARAVRCGGAREVHPEGVRREAARVRHAVRGGEEDGGGEKEGGAVVAAVPVHRDEAPVRVPTRLPPSHDADLPRQARAVLLLRREHD